MSSKFPICLFLIITFLSVALVSKSQLGLNYSFSSSNTSYESISGLPEVEQLLDTTASNYLVNMSAVNPIILNFGTIPFPFYCEGSAIGALSVDLYKGKIILNNGIEINASYASLVGCGPYVCEWTTGYSSGQCLNNVNALGVEAGNFVFSNKFSSSNNMSNVVSINGSQVCFANSAVASNAVGTYRLTYLTGRIYYGTIGQAPQRRFIVEFKNFHSTNPGAGSNVPLNQVNGNGNHPIDLINFQIIFYEGINAIGIHYGNCIYDPNDVEGYSSLGYYSGLTNENNDCDIYAVDGNSESVNELNDWCDILGYYYPNDNDLLIWSPIDLFDDDGDGFTSSDGDCNESNPLINPDTPETCDNVDNNCNSLIDEGFDVDLDGVNSCSGDCDDLDATIYPGAIDLADGIDNNCDGLIDENFDSDGDGVTPADGDCDDTDASIGPNQFEICNGSDDNCNLQVDEGFDLDLDGYTACAGDCDDADSSIYPGILDLEDGIDNDCDGETDENVDSDGDGVSPADGDCDDTNPAIGPNEIEFCNGIDDNCNVLIDENFDADADGFTLCNGDCNDFNAAINPGAIELDDNVDNNCDGLVDESFDSDGDGVTPADGDCNDNNPDISPNATEVCNSVDDNCNGMTDEDLDCSISDSELFIPTGFSPNNDGFNDTWQITGLADQSGYSIQVVNRWEQNVFYTNNYSSGWDGTYSGERLPASDYYYVITLSNGTVFSGALTIKY